MKVMVIVLILISSSVFSQSNSVDAIEVATRNMKKVTRTIDTIVTYKVYGFHGDSAYFKAKVKIFLAGEKLVAAQRIFDPGTIYENYFFYFDKDQVASLQYNKIGSLDLYVHEFPNIPQWEEPVVNAIIAFCRKKPY